MRKKTPLGVIKHKKNKKPEKKSKSPSIAHFLLTRFNLKRHAVRPEGWLEKRIALFEKYCLPSIANQTNKNFHWILFLEEETQEEMQPLLEVWQKEFPQIVPAWCNPFKGERLSQCSQPIIEELTGNKKYLLTSRIDNDDGLHPDTMQILRAYTKDFLSKQAPPKNGIVFDFPVGLRYQTETKNLYLWRRPHSPFMSLLLRAGQEKFRTVHSFPEGHGAVHKYAPVRFLSEKPAWIQVLHDTNISNTLGRGEKLLGNYEDFDFEALKNG